MRRRTWDQHGMVVRRGRQAHRPFGRVGEWPERQQALGAMQAGEAAEQGRRAAYRQQERQQPCGGCGAAAGFPHNLGCVTPWG